MWKSYFLNRFYFFGLFLAGLLMVLPQSSEGAFGVSPPFINASNLLKGSRFEQTIYLVQDQPNRDLRIQVNFDINEKVRDWFVFNEGKKIIIPKGVRQFPLKVEINIPKDADLGYYSGSLDFVGLPNEAEGQITIALGVSVAINMTVGTDISRDFKVVYVKPLDIEEGWAPRASVKVNNLGNISESFDGATAEILDKFGGARLAYIQLNNGFKEVPAFTSAENIIEFPIDLHLGLGQYWMGVSLFKEDKVVATEKAIFNVLKKGSLSPSWLRVLKSFSLDKWYGLVIAALLILLIGFRLYFKNWNWIRRLLVISRKK